MMRLRRFFFQPLLLLTLFIRLTVMVVAQDDGDFVFRLPGDAEVVSSEDSAVVSSGISVKDIGPLSIEQIITDTGISDWHTASWSGRGVRVGVIDLSFGGLDQLTFDVITPQVASDAEMAYSDDLDKHGTQVLEIIQSIAPEAELYACRYNNLVSFRECVEFMENARVRIVNHSGGVLMIDPSSAEQWVEVVEEAVVDSQILWVNAAGNYARGLIQDEITPDENGWHEFRGGGLTGQSLCIPASEEGLFGRVMLTWGNSAVLQANEIDLKLYIRPVSDCSTTREVFREQAIISQQLQTGASADLPIDWLTVSMGQPFEVFVLSRIKPGATVAETEYEARGVPFALLVDYGELPQGESAILTPGQSRLVLTVGALKADNDAADYSSRGTQAISVVKPDLVAPGEVKLSDGPFVGTSAAAPVVAGAAALIWEARDDWVVDRIREYIKDEVALEDTTGSVLIYGNGRLFMPPPPIRNAVGVTDVRIPYFTTFDTQDNIDPLQQWSHDGLSWRVMSESGNNILVGLSNIDSPLIVAGGQNPEWTSTDNIMISFDFRLERQGTGLRVVVRQNDEIGYHVVELLPGVIYVKRDDRGNELNYEVDRDREQNLARGLQSAAIETDRWYHIDLWLTNEYVYVYLDYELIIRALDQFSPPLQPGRIIFQAMDANRSVSIDNLSVMKTDPIANRFDSVSLPANWQTSNTQETSIEQENNDVFLRIRNGTRLNANVQEDLSDMLFSCDFRTVQENFSFYLREKRDGNTLTSGLVFDSVGGSLTVSRVEGGQVIWSEEIAPYFFSRGWDTFYVTLDGNQMEIRRDGAIYFQGTIGGEGLMDSGGISMDVSRRGILDIDDCLVVDTRQLENP